MGKALPSPDYLRQILRYDPETGKLFWLPRPRAMFRSDAGAKLFAAQYEGREAFTATSSTGYKVGNIGGRTFAAHRVIWAIVYGVWPEDEVDHISRVRSDNRLENLRDVSRVVNANNTGLSRRNRSGAKGVHRLPSGKWAGQARRDGRTHHLGSFDTPEEAEAARDAFMGKSNVHADDFRRAEDAMRTMLWQGA